MRFFCLAFVSAIVAVGCEKDQPLSGSTKKLTPSSEALGADLAKPTTAAPTKVMPYTANAAGVSDGENKGVQVEDREGEPMDDVDDPIPPTDESGVDKSGAAIPKTMPPGVRAEDDPEEDEVDGEE